MVSTDDDLKDFAANGLALPADGTEAVTPHQDARIWHASYGLGEPVILLHGGLGHSGNWGKQVPALVAAGMRATVIDSRGHGRSTRDERPLSYERMAGDVRAVMDAGFGAAGLSAAAAAGAGFAGAAGVAAIDAGRALPSSLKKPTRLASSVAWLARLCAAAVVSSTSAALRWVISSILPTAVLTWSSPVACSRLAAAISATMSDTFLMALTISVSDWPV